MLLRSLRTKRVGTVVSMDEYGNFKVRLASGVFENWNISAVERAPGKTATPRKLIGRPSGPWTQATPVRDRDFRAQREARRQHHLRMARTRVLTCFATRAQSTYDRSEWEQRT